MTDNRTTELLCKLLEERGIEWSHGDAAYETEWSTPDGRHCSAMYWKPTFTVVISGCTPEQAIAATLGEACEGCYLICDGKKFPVELDYGFTGLTPMPFAITVSGFRYSLEVPE